MTRENVGLVRQEYLINEDGAALVVGRSGMNSISREFLNRIKDEVSKTSSLGRLSIWLEKNTSLNGRNYSFKGHEYQTAIIDSKHCNQAVIKPSQCGLSEMSARLSLGFLAVQSNTVAMYILPTVSEALRFSKSRIDPIIRDSKYLSSVMGAGNDNAAFKMIGTSQLHMSGSQKAVISVPTDFLVTDELDFCDAENLVTAESRLTHSRFKDEDLNIRGIRRQLSTPTLVGVGISSLFEQSDKQYRLVKCKHCGEWSNPSFLDNVVVQGFDRSMHELAYTDVLDLDERGLLSTAQLLCPHCRNEITQANLQPEYREWVAESPAIRHTQGFSVNPLDLPEFHSPESILRKRLNFADEQGHFYNFVLGLPHDSSSNSILPSAVRDNTTLNQVQPGSTISGCVAGLDIGKTSWLTIGKPVRINGVEELHVLWAEQIRVDGNNVDNLFNTAVERFKQFGVVKAVIDSAPFWDTIIRIQAQFPEGLVLPAMYTLTDRNMPSYSVKETDWIVSVNRTKSIDYLVKQVNTGKVKFADFQEINTVAAHLQGMKRVERMDTSTGKSVERWQKIGPDHYFHSLNYLTLAASMITSGEYTNFAPRVSIKEAFVGRQHQQQEK